MKVDIIEDCDFSPNGITQLHSKAGDKDVDMPDDIALAFIGYGFCKEHKPAKVESKAIVGAPENKMMKGIPENKKVTAESTNQIAINKKKKAKKASK